MSRDMEAYELLRLREQARRERRAARGRRVSLVAGLVLIVWVLARFEAFPDSVVFLMCAAAGVLPLLFAGSSRT